MRSAQLALVSTLFAFAASPAFAATTLASCPAGGEMLSVTRDTAGKVTFMDQQSQIVSATFTTPSVGTFEYRISTAAGSFLSITRRADGTVGIWDRGVIGNQCDAGMASINLVELNKLVAESKAKEVKKYGFDKCSSAVFGNAVFSVRAGLEPKTVIFETVAPLSRSAENVVFAASSVESEGAAGSIYTTYSGEGAIIYYGAGTHTVAQTKLILRHSNVSGANSLTLDDMHIFSSNPFQNCQMSNLSFVEKTLK